MLQLIGFALLAGGLAMLGSLVVIEITDWRNRRQQARIQRIERGLAQAQQRLEVLALQHAAWLQGRAHEARKELIMESFRASHDARNTVDHEQR